jgi:hypothetical protein
MEPLERLKQDYLLYFSEKAERVNTAVFRAAAGQPENQKMAQQ